MPEDLAAGLRLTGHFLNRTFTSCVPTGQARRWSNCFAATMHQDDEAKGGAWRENQ
jgi:hypothetical protein